jgi:rubrerythrin
MSMTTEILTLLERCTELEHMAATVYEVLARRFEGDGELTALWSSLARDEQSHARKLATWHDLLANEPAEHRPQASGFEADIADLHTLLTESRVEAEAADQEEAFAIALALENSELDVIYTTLLQSSPLSRYPDLTETVRHETAGHHQKLLEMVGRRCRAEKTLLRAALLAGHHH